MKTSNSQDLHRCQLEIVANISALERLTESVCLEPLIALVLRVGREHQSKQHQPLHPETAETVPVGEIREEKWARQQAVFLKMVVSLYAE